jgi:hypothetical protein
LQLGVIGLDLPQLLHELVVFRIGDFGRVQQVVAAVVVVDDVDELLVALGCLGPLVYSGGVDRHASSLVRTTCVRAAIL